MTHDILRGVTLTLVVMFTYPFRGFISSRHREVDTAEILSDMYWC